MWRGLALAAVCSTPIWAVFIDRYLVDGVSVRRDWAFATRCTIGLFSLAGLGVAVVLAWPHAASHPTEARGHVGIAVSDMSLIRQALATQDLACPQCDYNLRGLQSGRCPECGWQVHARLSFSSQHWFPARRLLLALLAIIAFESCMVWVAVEVLSNPWDFANDSPWIKTLRVLAFFKSVAIAGWGLGVLFQWVRKSRSSKAVLWLLLASALGQVLTALVVVTAVIDF